MTQRLHYLALIVLCCGCASRVPVRLQETRPGSAREIDEALLTATRRFEGIESRVTPQISPPAKSRSSGPAPASTPSIGSTRTATTPMNSVRRDTTARGGGTWRLEISDAQVRVEVRGPVNFEWIPPLRSP